MSVRIEKINVKDLGPITTFTHDLKQINLVFGQNEKGKTSLVEFVIKALFQNPKNWNVRGIGGKGKVLVSGLSDKDIEFQPESPRKIESYWETSQNEFPQDFSRLLVVRAAEVALTKEKTGINSVILKQYLTGAGLLDKIVEKIPATLQAASVEKNSILGANRGDIRKIGELESEYSQLIGLEKRINEELSEGMLFELKNQQEKVEDELSDLKQAKRFRAFELHEKILQIDSELGKYPVEELDSIAGKISNWHQLKRILKEEVEKLEKATVEAQHYNWLKTAKDVFETRSVRKIPKHIKYFLFSGLLLLGGTAFAYFYLLNPFASIITLILGFGLIGYYIFTLNRIIAFNNDLEDIKAIEKGYKERFGGYFHGLVDIHAQLERIEPYYYERDNLEKSSNEKKQDLTSLEDEIKGTIIKIYQQDFSLSDAKNIVQELKGRIKNLTDNKNKLETELAILQVDPAYYLDIKPKVSWDLARFEKILLQQENIEGDIQVLENAFSDLKQSSRDIAGIDITDSWEVILWKIQEKIIEKEQESHELLSKCIAQVLIHQLAQNLQISEEEKILDGLQSSEIEAYIKKITDRYSDIDYRDGVLSVKDEFGAYQLEELSTGTIEQVFLSLRMGFAAKIAGSESLFLILDDAFQYSDWERRPRLVDQVVELAKQGWQIIYFSMDDHIRDLFVERAGKVLKKEFSLIEI